MVSEHHSQHCKWRHCKTLLLKFVLVRYRVLEDSERLWRAREYFSKNDFLSFWGGSFAHLLCYLHTVSPRIQAAACIKFFILLVRLVFKGGVYSRAACIRGNTVYGNVWKTKVLYQLVLIISSKCHVIHLLRVVTDIDFLRDIQGVSLNGTHSETV